MFSPSHHGLCMLCLSVNKSYTNTFLFILSMPTIKEQFGIVQIYYRTVNQVCELVKRYVYQSIVAVD